MFYQMISKARDRWLASSDCTIKDLIAYIEGAGQLRDAQIDAIKTYLFLKIACGCRPLYRLFGEGRFNTLDLREAELTAASRTYLESRPEAAALLEYALLENDAGEQLSRALAEQMRREPGSVDCRQFFRDAFYGVAYTDYLFSLPMGAGKTYLMAAFIYLDLYFAANEPLNPAFAHNFIIFAPSGLKSSVVPSLRTIQKFDPAWVIPEPAASNIRRTLSFEVLDQSRTAGKSNRTKNPNVRKIASHQPLPELFGLVAVTNAEKVILDRIQEENGQISMLEESDGEKDRQANELRSLIGTLPSLAVFIDEVHHAVSDEIKLRSVVNRWTDGGGVNSVIGFSGTPYLERAEKITVTDELSVAAAGITNTVYYYPLSAGVGSFLKRPTVKIADIADSGRIIENGVREFLDEYKDTVYQNGTSAKLGIYCGTIEKLEELVYPLVLRVAGEYGLPPDCILRFHKGNRRHPQPADSQMQFDTLDSPVSKIRIVLLVQIGKEGWDCRSLTGIILSQEGDCPRNMVLQTSCRCLRQVDRGQPETALIYLNRTNGDKLIDQLNRRHHISLDEFAGPDRARIQLRRYDRTAYLKLPKLKFYQLKVSFETVTEEEADPRAGIERSASRKYGDVVKTTNFSLEDLGTEVDDAERGEEPAVFPQWLYGMVKSSFGFLTMEQLSEHAEALRAVFDTITYERDGARRFSSRYDRPSVEAGIRKSFCSKRACKTETEHVPESASLLNPAGFKPTVGMQNPAEYFPSQEVVERIIRDDRGKLKPDRNTLKMMELAEQAGQTQVLELLRSQTVSHPQKNRSFHCLPYHMDSAFERKFLRELLPLREVERFDLEIYYNGDRTMTEFKIKCYKLTANGWTYVGMYTPDFLIIQRRDGEIHKALIVETKGRIYANDPKFKDKRAFMESEFLRMNNAAFGYERFAYLYLEDTVPEKERIVRTRDKICDFFEEGGLNAG